MTVALNCGLIFVRYLGCIRSTYLCMQDIKDIVIRRRRSLPTQDDLAPELSRRLIAATNYGVLGQIVCGDDIWFQVDSRQWWETVVQPSMADNSDGGKLLTQAEYDVIHTFPLPVNITRAVADKLIIRFNNTYYNWDHGTLQGDNMVDYTEFNKLVKQIKSDTKKANQAGFKTLADWFEDGLDAYNNAEKADDAGVCAVVRIRIQQRLAITRDAFEATLEIDNGESDILAGIKVVVVIRDHATKEKAAHKFAIGEPEVSGMESVDGNGVLEMGVAGTATWFIIPYSEAAPTHDVHYDIGGTLFYMVGGQNITVPLFPETITVTPDPRLYLNYFLERNVRSDDPMTKDVIEPTMPFTLGLLITNDGYGAAKNTRITSGQPEIIENEKGLLIAFKIIGAQVDDQPVSPSLTVTFGDIQPHSTRVSTWLMTSTLKGTFNNYTATFENVNPLGDPQLSVMESVLFHELLHVVRVDLPEDDGLVDFLVFSENKLDLFPDRIYDSTDGRHPLNVSSCNITSIGYVSATEMQVHVTPNHSGWVYFRYPYTGNEHITPVSAVRSDTDRSVNVEYNLWIDRLQNVTYLQVIDYIDTPGVSFKYDVTVTRSNTYSPRFEQTEFRVNVSEDVIVGKVVILPNVTDNDAGQRVEYSIENFNTELALPFEINATTGAVQVIGQLDREVVGSYTFSVIASDNGTPVRTSAAAVLISVLDVNDNVPVFDPFLSDVDVEETATVGYELATMTASDADAGDNGVVDVHLLNLTSLFAYNTTTGRLTTAASLAGKAGQYALLLRASDKGLPTSRWTEVTLVVRVVASNIFTPEFEQPLYKYDVLETVTMGTHLGRVNAVDQDNGSVVYYAIAEETLVPFAVDATTGNMSTKATLDRETTINYTFHVLAFDNGASPTGPKTATADVTVTVGDINDNAPSFPSKQFSQSVEENSAAGTEVMRTKAVDVDAGDNGDIASYSLQPPSAPFAVSVDCDFAVIRTTQVLDAEETDNYDLQLVAVDKGTPPMTTSVLVRVDVTDVNDNSPHLRVTNLEMSLPRVTAVNTLITTFTASDADVSGEFSRVFYTVVSASTADIVAINSDTGVLRLLSSLSSVSSEMVNVTVRASDGLHDQVVHLTMHIVEQNRYGPAFKEKSYSLSLMESTAVGTTVLRVSADDADSSGLAFSVVSGNKGNVFSLKPLSGELVLLGSLDRESTASYELVIEVSDGGIDGDNVLSASATVTVTVLDVNEFSPLFDDGAVFQVAVEEEATRHNILTVSASDGDGGVITYSIASADEHFAINSSTGQIDLITSFDRETVQEVRLEVWATDNGSPAKSSSAEVFVTITNINDNAPEFGQEAYSVSVEESTAEGTTVLRINASDSDSPVLTFSIASGNTANAFSLKPLSGELVLLSSLDRETTASYELVIEVSDGGIDGDNVLSASTTVTVTVLDVNEFSPQFDNGTLFRVVVQEEETSDNIITLSASDGDDDVITYSISSADEHFAINASTGQIDLVKSLDRESVQEVRLEVWATDNGTPARSSSAEVFVTITNINEKAPEFEQESFSVSVKESTDKGTTVLRVNASDADSRVLTFSIVSGNTANAFSLEPLSGELVLLGSLDRETTARYELVIEVSDGGINGDNVLSASATVTVTVLDVNEFSPQFVNGAVYNVTVTEKEIRPNIVTVLASDGDKDVITYSIAIADEHFAINASTGQIDLVKSLDRESVQEVRLEVWATDDGTPAKSSTAEVVVTVTDIDDRDPVLDGAPSTNMSPLSYLVIIIISVILTVGNC